MSTTITSDAIEHVVTRAWSGAANNSPSIEYVDGSETRRNLIGNPSFEGGLTGWNTSATLDTTHAHTGTSSALMRTVNGDTNYLSALTNQPVQTGEAYTSSAWVLAPTDLGVTYYLQALLLDAAGDVLTYIPSTTGIRFATADWTRVSQSFTIPDGAVSLALVLSPSNETPAPADALYVDDVLLETGTELLPYFDGNTEPSAILAQSTPLLVDGWQESVDTRTVVNTIVGGGTDITPYPAGLRTGQYVAVFQDEEDAAALVRMHQQPARFTVQDTARPSIGMLYVPVGTITRTLDDDTRDYWLVTIPYQEVDG
jgi:hypothetical protein